MKIVLILGAGVSRSMRPKASISKRPPLDTDFFDIAKKINPTLTGNILNCLKTLVGDYAESLSKSLETTTSYLYIKAIDSKKNSIYHSSFLDLLRLLTEVLAHTTNPLKLGPRSLVYRFIFHELDLVNKPSDLTILTFNYDLLVELALDNIQLNKHSGIFCFPGCYRLDNISSVYNIKGDPKISHINFNHHGVSILKLHGSLNWQSEHNSPNPPPNVLFNPKRNIYILSSTNINESLTWKPYKKTKHLKPVIVPPVSSKREKMHSRLVKLWKKAGKELRDADRVVIAGYSCPPLDLEARILLSENLTLNKSKKVYIINPDANVASRFSELCDIDHMTIYDSIDNWLRDKPNKSP